MSAQHAAEPAAPPAAAASDPLTDSILYLAAHHGRALSRNALLAGLPITDGRLNVTLYERAAARAGLEIEVVQRKITDIPPLVLPAVLIMRDGSTRILHEVNRDPRIAKVVDPSTSEDAKRAPLDAEAADYLGYAILVRPTATADAHAAAAGEDAPRQHWFWSVVSKFW